MDRGGGGGRDIVAKTGSADRIQKQPVSYHARTATTSTLLFLFNKIVWCMLKTPHVTLAFTVLTKYTYDQY